MNERNKYIAKLLQQRGVTYEGLTLSPDKIAAFGDPEEYVVVYHEDAFHNVNEGFIGFLDISNKVTSSLPKELQRSDGWYSDLSENIERIFDEFQRHTKID